VFDSFVFELFFERTRIIDEFYGGCQINGGHEREKLIKYGNKGG
jgi:hypothetical protein